LRKKPIFNPDTQFPFMHRGLHVLFLTAVIFGLSLSVSRAQPAWTLDPFGSEKKPTQYQDKKLGSEKTADKKFTPVRHMLQNTFTRYNYYFNADNKIRYVLEQAKLSNQDDYTKLLAFYPYTLKSTSAQQSDLDSVINKATAGILLHDLRNDWVDDLYLLMGKAYLFLNELDTAAMTFQFINYNLYPRKNAEDDGRIIGSNAGEKGSMFSIADKENQNLIQKTFNPPPCRNDALIWLIRTFVEDSLFSDASSMINILHADPNLPERLRDDLEEVTAYWFYRQGIYDSCAVHLENALSNAESSYDRARWEYLLGQLYEMNQNFSSASRHYLKSATAAIDPVMDIYAHLNNAKMLTDKANVNELKSSIQNLQQMSKKDKYEAYRDILFNAAGKLSLLVPDTSGSITCFLKSLKYNEGNERYRNSAFLALAQIYYGRRDYRSSAAYYDSLNLQDPDLEGDTAVIASRKAVLMRVVDFINIIEREDSLQHIALLSPADRDALLKQLVKKYKKEKGEPETEDNNGYVPIAFNNTQAQPSDLFAAPSKGEWYFYNASLRSKGLNEFRLKWGNRANTDNWRRSKAMDVSIKNMSLNVDIDAPVSDTGKTEEGEGKLVPFSYDALLADIPLTQEQKDSSEARIANALLKLAAIFQSELEDYQEAVRNYEEYLLRFPAGNSRAEVYLGLYYCYSKMGDAARAAEYKNKLLTEFADSRSATAITNPGSIGTGEKTSKGNAAYERIYNLFIEGRFDEALAAKKSADSISGTAYWTPQLLYIQAVYYVKQRLDDQAIAILDDLMARFPESPLKEKAQNLKDVVSRRAEIESYLNQLQVSRETDTRIIVADNKPAPAPRPTENLVAQPQVAPLPQTINRPAVTGIDSIRTIPGMAGSGYVLEPEKPHAVLMILNKVDAVYINEAVNAMARFNRENAAYRAVTIRKEILNADNTLIAFDSFEEAGPAMAYLEKIRKAAPNYVSWLQPSKYFFLIITAKNLEVLRQNKDLQQYRNLLNSQYGNKF